MIPDARQLATLAVIAVGVWLAVAIYVLVADLLADRADPPCEVCGSPADGYTAADEALCRFCRDRTRATFARLIVRSDGVDHT